MDLCTGRCAGVAHPPLHKWFCWFHRKGCWIMGLKMTSLVLLLGHHLQGAEGLQWAGDHRAAFRTSLCRYCWLVEMVYKTLGCCGVQFLPPWQNIRNGQSLQDQWWLIRLDGAKCQLDVEGTAWQCLENKRDERKTCIQLFHRHQESICNSALFPGTDLRQIFS